MVQLRVDLFSETPLLCHYVNTQLSMKNTHTHAHTQSPYTDLLTTAGRATSAEDGVELGKWFQIQILRLRTNLSVFLLQMTSSACSFKCLAVNSNVLPLTGQQVAGLVVCRPGCLKSCRIWRQSCRATATPLGQTAKIQTPCETREDG